MKRKIIKTVLFAVLIFNLSSCTSSKHSEGNVALVDGVAISSDTYLKELDFYQKYYSQKFGEGYLDQEVERGKTNKDILEKDLVDSLVKDQVMVNDLKANNIKVDDNVASSLRKDLEEKLGGKDSLKANVNALGTDENKFNQVLYNDSIRNQHYNYYLSHNDIKDSEVLEYYKANEKYHKEYKYDILVFDDQNEANKIHKNLKSPADFKSYLNKPVQNYEVINSDFVYNDDPLLKEAGVLEKDEISDIFKYEDKYMILMINSYNENENDLLINVKDIYLKEKYEDYLNKLVKKSKIRLFV